MPKSEQESIRDVLNAGSTWLRWEPHIHTPGTIFNDQFAGPDPWSAYLDLIEKAEPAIRALGVTDYYVLNSYERALEFKKAGRLKDCPLLFANVELRLSIGTIRGNWVNIHLLISPADDDHVKLAKEFLAELKFKVHAETFSCTPEHLMRLGKKHDSKIADDQTALKVGALQFKVGFDNLKDAFHGSKWAQENILIGLSGSSQDGSSGIRDAADSSLRAELETFAHLIFASSPAQRAYWLGEGAASPEVLKDRYAGLKPCIHGSDAHDASKVGHPDAERRTWIKGAATFDSLVQACIEPNRAYVGTLPPPHAPPSQVILGIDIEDAPWAANPRLALNAGLVTIIGARGSGKTALAEMIAAGCDAAYGTASAVPEKLRNLSFLERAHDELAESSVQLTWGDNDSVTRSLDHTTVLPPDTYERARYLSQQFVESLCSADGMTDALLREVERVIFEAHSMDESDGAIDFRELLDDRAARTRAAREREESSLDAISNTIGDEIEKIASVDVLAVEIAQKKKIIAGHGADRAKLVPVGDEARTLRLAALTDAAEAVRGYVRHFHDKHGDLIALQDEVKNLRSSQAPESLRQSRARHVQARLSDAEWLEFLVDYKGDVDATLTRSIADALNDKNGWKGVPPQPGSDDIALIPDDAVLKQQPLAVLEAEIARLGRLVSNDADIAKRFATITKKVTQETNALKVLNDRYESASKAKDRLQALVVERDETYERVFQAITDEERILRDLYRPLMERIERATGTLGKLSFRVARSVDLAGWAEKGESFLDLRRKGFRGAGFLAEIAGQHLRPAWTDGSAADVRASMTQFFGEYHAALLEGAQVQRANSPAFRSWGKEFAQWLFSTRHIEIHYSIEYAGVDIRKLSPGTRGIVLLLLYLGLDDNDGRPLIIDQPEENLDPKSIYDELVQLFIAAKARRQVILVTHNANLVVNTDADQIIVATSTVREEGGLPRISYLSGGLEDAVIREQVCDILEGGETAFKERARRLRVRLER